MNDFDPTRFHQESPPTRQGERAVGDLVEKAIFGPKKEPASKVSSEAPKVTTPAPKIETPSPTMESHKPSTATKMPTFKPVKGEHPHNTFSNYHQQMADYHNSLHKQTNKPEHLTASEAHADAAKVHQPLTKIHQEQITTEQKHPSFEASHKAEQLSHGTGVKFSLGQQSGLPMEETKDGEGGKPAKPVGSGSRGGYPRYWRRTAAYGVQSPNLLGSFAGGYGLGLAAASPGGPMFQTAQLVQQGVGKLQSLASARRWPINVAQPIPQPEDHTAVHQRQQQLQQTNVIANKSIEDMNMESTPVVRAGTRRLNK